VAQYFTDFEEYSTGALPSDWTVRINANDTWTVETTGSDKYLQLNDPDSGQYISWDGVDADAERQDSEVIFQWQRSSGTSGNKPAAVIRLVGDNTAFSGYRCGGSSSTFQLYKAVSATAWTSLGSVSYTHSGSTDYWVRFRVNGSSVQAKIWSGAIGDEPANWTGTGSGWAALTATDSDVTGDGWTAAYGPTSNSTAFIFWLFGVGTNGDTAPSSSGATDTPVNPGVGNLVITGYAPTLAQTANQALTPDVGNLVIMGHAPSIVRSENQQLTPDTGTLAITGYAPAVTQSSNIAVAPGVGSLTITGYAPTIQQSAASDIIPSTGTITITGYAPTIAQSDNLQIFPDAGPVVITGYAPTVTQSDLHVANPGVGSLSITGYAPTVTQLAGLNIQPAAGTIVIAGHIPTVTRTINNNAYPDPGTVVITGYAPTVARTTGTGGSISTEDIWSYEIEAGKTAEELMRMMAAVLLGKTTVTDLGGGNALVTFEAANGSRIRVTATMTGSERTSMTYDDTF
jgi:hypothetical protein